MNSPHSSRSPTSESHRILGQVLPLWWELLAESWEISGEDARPGGANGGVEVLTSALQMLVARGWSHGIALYLAVGGRWQPLAQTAVEQGASHVAWPLQQFKLLSAAADHEGPVIQVPYAAAPLRFLAGKEATESYVLAICHRDESESALRTQIQSLAPMVNSLLTLLNHRRRSYDSSQLLAAHVELLSQWDIREDIERQTKKIAEVVAPLFAADHGVVLLWDRESKQLQGPLVATDANSDIVSQSIEVGEHEGVAGRAFRTGTSQRMDVASESPHDSLATLLPSRSTLTVPIGHGRRRQGVMQLWRAIENPFQHHEQTQLQDFAERFTTALENSHYCQQMVGAPLGSAPASQEVPQLIGNSPATVTLRDAIGKVAATELPVLILGENGTGKEITSRLIHAHSDRRSEPFVAVNCAALTETLLESELFGHEKGAFTDAHTVRIGKFESAATGTLFLDEIGDLSPGGQAKLLRVLDEKLIVRVGGSVTIPTDARVIAATNQDLANMVRQKTFRQDLFFRLNAVTLNIVPLRERPEDIVGLANHFLQGFCVQANRPPMTLDQSAEQLLVAHTWPGNIRELRNVMERIAYLLSDAKITSKDLTPLITPSGRVGSAGGGVGWGGDLDEPLAEATRLFQVEYIQQQILSAGGNMTEAAERLGLHRSNLYRKMRQLGIATGHEED